jgi:hypothetical protein
VKSSPAARRGRLFVDKQSGRAKNVKAIGKTVDFHLDQSKQAQEKNRAGAYTERASHIQQEIKHE